MEDLSSILKRKTLGTNVNDDKNIYNNVYDENVASKIENAVDKPRAIGEDLAEKLGAPNNLRLYIKLARQYSIATLYECLALTEEAYREGLIRTTKAQYFYGIVIRKKTL